MPFKSKAQARFMFAKHPKIAKEFADKTKSVEALPEHKPQEKYTGKGTRARLNTAARKMFFGS